MKRGMCVQKLGKLALLLFMRLIQSIPQHIAFEISGPRFIKLVKIFNGKVVAVQSSIQSLTRFYHHTDIQHLDLANNTLLLCLSQDFNLCCFQQLYQLYLHAHTHTHHLFFYTLVIANLKKIKTLLGSTFNM